MGLRSGGAEIGAGTLAPAKYTKYTVQYTDTAGGYIAAYSYFNQSDTLLATVEIEYDGSGRDIRGELVYAI